MFAFTDNFYFKSLVGGEIEYFFFDFDFDLLLLVSDVELPALTKRAAHAGNVFLLLLPSKKGCNVWQILPEA